MKIKQRQEPLNEGMGIGMFRPLSPTPPPCSNLKSKFSQLESPLHQLKLLL